MSMLTGTRRALLGGKQRSLDFDPGLVTFTAGMAKRAGSVFAAAPIVQGAVGVSQFFMDEVSYSAGSAISAPFYATLDMGQGSIVFWITPEWNGNDGRYHAIWGTAASGVVLWKTSGNVLTLNAASGVAASVSISGWVAAAGCAKHCVWSDRS